MLPSEEIKQKLDIVDIIREYLPLKAAGANFQALCPFHTEKSPSFLVSADKQIWHCFGCGRGGDVFAFIMEKEGQTFPEAVRFLAPKAGVTLHDVDRQSYSKRNRLLDIMDLSAKYYQHQLHNSQAGKKMLEYLQERGLKEETIEEWGIGYSPDSWDSLLEFFSARAKAGKGRYLPEELFSAGLLIQKDGGRGYYDRFRDRIMFPIKDASGNVIAFSARINPGSPEADRQGKYINSPQTEIYDKSRALFGIDKAKGEIRKQGKAIIVEGQMDVIACHQSGFINTVASSGTALTSSHLDMIKRFAGEVVLAFDMDSAGQMAANRGLEAALASGFKVSILQLPFGKDPSDALKTESDSFRYALEHCLSVLDYYYSKVKEGKDLSRTDDKREVAEKMGMMIQKVRSAIEQSMWVRKVSEELGFDEAELRREIAKYRQVGYSRENIEQARSAVNVSSRQEKLYDSFLAILLRFPNLIPFALSNLSPDLSSDSDGSSFYQQLAIEYGKEEIASFASLSAAWSGQEGLQKRLEALSLLGERDYYQLDQLGAKNELIKVMVEIRQMALRDRISALQNRIAQAEQGGEDDLDLDLMMEELKILTDELKSIKLA